VFFLNLFFFAFTWTTFNCTPPSQESEPTFCRSALAWNLCSVFFITKICIFQRVILMYQWLYNIPSLLRPPHMQGVGGPYKRYGLYLLKMDNKYRLETWTVFQFLCQLKKRCFNDLFNEDHIQNILSYKLSLSLIAWVGFESTTLVAIATDCIGSYKSNYHKFMTMTAPQDYDIVLGEWGCRYKSWGK
jgi:hypothetical protein